MTADLPARSVADVRMRGFARRTTVADALAWIEAHARRLSMESIDLWQAAGRVLAEDVVSPVDVPRFERSMMDGYAVQAGDTQGASAYHRLPLTVIGQSLPGLPFDETLARGQAVRIMTGAPLPVGADAVLPAELAESAGSLVYAIDAVPPRKNVGRRGEDIQAGAQVLAAGRVLRPQDLGVLSSIGRASAVVVRHPRVRIVITGNELVAAGSQVEASDACQIADANGPMLAALVARDGGMAELLSLPEGGAAVQPMLPYLVPDDPAAIVAAMQSDCDVVIVSGGSSVGQEDHAPVLLAENGELAIHGIAMRPSSPTGMGTLAGRLVFLLPGNPVSCLCGYDFFAGRAIRLLGGRSADWPYRALSLPLARKLVSQVGRVDYARVQVREGCALPLAISGASLLTSTTEADGFVVVPADSEGFAAGSEVEVFLYD
jgi:molybdopterin molybdotransferase